MYLPHSSLRSLSVTVDGTSNKCNGCWLNLATFPVNFGHETLTATFFYLAGAVTGLTKGDVLLLLAVHAHAALGWIPLGVSRKLHLCDVIKEFREMLLDLRAKTYTITLSSTCHAALFSLVACK